MLTEEELADVIDPSVRARLIEAVVGKDIPDLLDQLRWHCGHQSIPFKGLPKELWPYIPLIVPGEGENGEGVEVVETNETTLSLYRGRCSPDLTWVDFSALGEQVMQSYSSYLTSYIGFLQGEYGKLEAQKEVRTHARKTLLDFLPSYYRDEIPKKDRERLAKIDPLVRQWAEEILVLDISMKGLKERIHLLGDRVKQVSRDIEVRRMRWEVEKSMGFGGGPQKTSRSL